MEAILDALEHEAATGGANAEWAGKTYSIMRTKSPFSLKLALQQVRRGVEMDFEECMRTEFRIVSRVIEGRDFYEGVRAAIVDKDNKPRWWHDSVATVSGAEVASYFAPLPDELVLT